MYESEIFKSVNGGGDYASGYSMPEVYVATASAVLYRVRRAGKYFIIKTPKDNLPQSLAMLQREYELSLGKSHPNIVNIFTYEPHTIVGPGIIMEYVDGRTLADFIAENPPRAMRERVFVQLLQAVAYIHRCGMVHNDIKPQNILVTRADNDVRLIDFGLANDDAHYLARTLGCTPAYASPELLAQQEVDARSDIYSLGVVMRALFGSRHSRIASRCLCSKKEKRYANVEALHNAFKLNTGSLKPIATILFALLLLVPILYFSSIVIADKRRVAARNAMVAQIEKDVMSMYECSCDSVEQAPYFEFAVNHIVEFLGAMGEYQVKNVTSVIDPELNSILSAVYMKKLTACNDTLWQKAGKLQSLHKCGLPLDAVLFYDSLVGGRHRYVPYE